MTDLTFKADYINILTNESAFEITARAYLSGIKESSSFKTKYKQLFIPNAKLVFPDGAICYINHEEDQQVVHKIDTTSNSLEESEIIRFKLNNKENHALASGARLEFQLRISSPNITSDTFCFELSGTEWKPKEQSSDYQIEQTARRRRVR